MSVQRQVFNKIIKVVKILLIVLTILAILFFALLCICIGNDNERKSENFSEKDYKIISSVFGIDEGTFEIKDVFYYPQIDDEKIWYTEGGDNELYIVTIFMDYDDIPLLEKNYNIKDLNEHYIVDLVKSKFSNDVGVYLYLGCDYDDPDLCRVELNYHGHNDELHDILPFFSFQLKVFAVLFAFLFVLIWTCFRDGKKSKSKNVSE